MEAPELSSGTIEIKEIAREAGSRSKIAVVSHDEHIDPVGSLVGQRGIRVSVVMGELGGEKIDIIEWSEDPQQFVEDALSPAKVLSVTVNEKEKEAIVEVSEDQQSLAIGKGGQNVRLAAKLTGWRIDIRGIKGESIAEADSASVTIAKERAEEKVEKTSADPIKTVIPQEGTTSNEEGESEAPLDLPAGEAGAGTESSKGSNGEEAVAENKKETEEVKGEEIKK